MGRRSLFVAIAAIAAALVPASAYAAVPGTTPTLGSAPFANTVTINWTPAGALDAPLTQEAWRGAGACGTPPIGGAAAVPIAGNPATATTATDPNVPDGVYCYYVQADNLGIPLSAFSAGLTVTVDVGAPTATIDPAETGPPNYVRGTINIASTSADAGTGVAPSSGLHVDAPGACGAASPAVVSPWDSTAVADGVWDLCNVVNDNAAHTAVDAETVVVDNTAPTGAVVTPLAGAAVSGDSVALTVTAADATAGIRNVQWQRSATGGNPWVNINGAVGVGGAANGYLRNWNTLNGGTAVGDGPEWVRAQIRDNTGAGTNPSPGNQVYTAPIAVTVDNTPPDAAAVLTAPPAVAGTPTLNWTPAHDAVGIDHYEVRRSVNGAPATVIATRGFTGAASYSWADGTAPDQQTSSYVVRAFDATGHTVDSNAAAVLVDSQAKSAPQTLAAATPTASAPALSWKAPPVFTVDHYDVYRDGLMLASTVGPATTYVDATALEGVHDYAVLARSAGVQSGVLSSSFKVLLDKTAPTSGGAPTAQVLPAGGIQLAWPAAGDALSGVAGYAVRRMAGGSPPAATDAGTEVCAPAATSCTDSAMVAGTWSYGVFARDGAGNVALIGTVANVVIVDATAPLAPTKLSLIKPKAKKAGSTLTFTLRWVNPTALDLDRVVVVLNLKRPPTAPSDGKAVYKGLKSSAKIKLRAGQTGYLAVFAYDHSGNFSAKPARTTVKLASLIPLRPLNGSVVRSSSPLLTWKAKKGTTYYNVLVFLKGKRVLVGWPSKASYRIPAGKLKPGTYVWYVWPAVKGKSATPAFGKLIGRATFTYKKKK